jgi:hypothetical protein
MWETVGIPEVEARVYEALIPHGRTTVDDLANRVNFSTAKTARALTRLISRAWRPGRPAGRPTFPPWNRHWPARS